jgi:enoyl-CoA hydratase
VFLSSAGGVAFRGVDDQPEVNSSDHPAPWYDGSRDGPGAPFADRPVPADDAAYRTLTYEVTGRIARITFDRPERGNAITADTPVELAAAVERADLDPRVHVIVVSGNGPGFCGGYDLDIFAEHGLTPSGDADDRVGTVLDPVVQAANHDPARQWDPMLDFAMMSRFNRGFASLMHANKPTVAKLHGFCVAGGTDIALFADQIIAAADCKIGYPPTRVWGVPAAGMWAHRLGDQRAKRLLFTGDSITGAEAAEWGLVVEAPPADQLDERTELLLERIARMPLNQLMMVKLALNTALQAQGVATSTMISSVFDGIARHTREGYAFQQRAAEVGFRQAVAERDDPYGDRGRSTFKG